MSTRHYVKITASEMVEFLNSRGFAETKPMSGERIYVRTFAGKKELMVYSSIAIGFAAARDRGADAIRLVYRDNSSGNHRKAGKVLRIETWRDNLTKKIDEAIEKFSLREEADRCVYCGHEPNGTTDDGQPVCSWHQMPLPGIWDAVNEATLVAPDPRIVLCEA